MLDILFFGTHPDDVELCCGGTVINLVSSGKKVGIIDLTQGELGTRGNVRTRQAETKAANKVLGVKFRSNLNITDGNISNNQKNQLKIIQQIRQHKPEIIFAPYPIDRHPDHVNANKLIKESAFYSGLAKIKTKLGGKAQKPFRPKRIFYYMQTYTFVPSFITDITKSFDKKIKAMMCYKTQFYNPKSKETQTFISSKKFLDFIKTKAKFYGFQIGAKYGEPFYCETPLNISTENLIQS